MPRPADFRESDHAEFAFAALMAPRAEKATAEDAYAMSYLIGHLMKRHGALPAWSLDASRALGRCVPLGGDPWPFVLSALAIPAAFWDARPTAGKIRRRILAGTKETWP